MIAAPPKTVAEIRFGMSDAEYRARPGVSQSMLKHLHGPDGSPALYRRRLTEPVVQTRAMRLGHLADLYILSPDEFDRVAVNDGGREYRKDVDKTWRDEHLAAGRVPVKPDEIECFKSMKAAVWAHPEAAGLLARAKTQVSVFSFYTFSDGVTIPIRGRLDILPDFSPSIADQKKTVDATQAGFGDQIQKLGMHFQGAMYRYLYNSVNGADQPRNDFRFIAVQEDAWVDDQGEIYGVGVYPMTDDDFAAGEALLHRDMETLRHCMESGKWPGWSKDAQWAKRPQWAAAREMEELKRGEVV